VAHAHQHSAAKAHSPKGGKFSWPVVTRFAAAAVLGLVVGFVLGMMMSETIAIVGFLVFGKAVGFKLLPVATALICAAAAPKLFGRSRP
jgi:hypothetical protein